MRLTSIRPSSLLLLLVTLLSLTGPALLAQTPAEPVSVVRGPYNGVFLPDGNSLIWPVESSDPVLAATAPWTISLWFQSAEPTRSTLLGGIGEPTAEDVRYLALRDGRLTLWMGGDKLLSAPDALPASGWHFAAATFDGEKLHLFGDGRELATGTLTMGRIIPSPAAPLWPGGPPSNKPPAALVEAAPVLPASLSASWTGLQHFGGHIAAFTLTPSALTTEQLRALSATPPNPDLIIFDEGSKSWPVQTRGQAGYRSPQDPSQMPRSRAAFQKPAAKPEPPARTTLKPVGDHEWILDGGWRLTPAPEVSADGAVISQSGFNASKWWLATVPGTVLTTMIDRGVYPDSDYGLNNLAIPEKLNKQDYWYRAEFSTPKAAAGRHLTLTFNGINYAAEVWVNGQRIGNIKGAFVRGVFDVTALIKPGQNTVAVRISPPPHPGIPQEQSIKGGPGENGGIMVLDGPTFVATEGWDWIPGIRDRNTGLWQDVTLSATGDVKLGDAQVVTTLPLPDTSRADVAIDVPITNASSAPVSGTLTAAFEGVSVTKSVTVAPGGSSIRLAPAEFAQLALQHPRLWWPNGYGKPDLYHLKLSFSAGGSESDSRSLTFGVREITYELSLYDSTGHLRRVEVSPTVAHNAGQRIIDVSHNGMRQIPDGWVASLLPGAENSSAVKPTDDPAGTSDLILKVNGVRIAARGGNWGMDDSRKRVSREHLEPYFRLHRDANVNIIRNWVGQDTEQTFYDLADEYGMLVWNDFWESTQDYNIEAQDPDLFLNNARDTIARFRNHPSIVMWCGRNEGVPQPIISDGLEALTQSLDGTRYYSPSSNRVNLRNSGPYRYIDPVSYYRINRGFSVELGVPSFSTLEAFKASIAPEDQWPPSDAWAYHDWHQSGNGEVAPFMEHMEAAFGAPTGLEDFERKAQMIDYVSHRAIFEGFNAHLFEPNSARMLWMTQPAWPSNMWEIFSSDYDTQSSFYGVQRACEPLHAQLDLTSFEAQAVNTTGSAASGLTLDAKVYSLDNKLLLQAGKQLDLAADALTHGPMLDLAPLIARQTVLIHLSLTDAAGKVVSQNFYWLAGNDYLYRQLNTLPAGNVAVSAKSSSENGEGKITAHLENRGSAAVLQIKLTLQHASDGTRVLPAYLDDNYVSLLPGEARDITIRYPSSEGAGGVKLGVRGWNLASTTAPVTQ